MKAEEVPGCVCFTERTQVTLALAIAELLKAQGLTELQCTSVLLGMTVASAQLAQVDEETFSVLAAEAWHQQVSLDEAYHSRMRALVREVDGRKA